MFDITDKDALIQEIMNEIGYPRIDNCYSNEITGVIMNEVKYKIEMAIDEHVRKAVQSVIMHLYTHSEFEQDMGLS